MPRKTRALRRGLLPPASRFNEAAARCRGKPPRSAARAHRARAASMRPRPDAAENAATKAMEGNADAVLQ